MAHVMGDVHTNTIEGFWSLLKGGISGSYRGVSKRHSQAYLDEYAFRYSDRDTEGRGMFTALFNRISKVSKCSASPR